MRSLAAVVALLFLACNSTATSPGGSAPAGEATAVLRVGESKQVNPELRVAFAQVVEDSRCPASVNCVWQGNGAVRLEIASGGSVHSATLNTAGGPPFPQEATVAGWTFTLVTLEPQPRTPDPIPAQDYRATIRITRAGA